MIDFGRISDMVGGLLGGSLQEAAANVGFAEILERVGLDPAQLEGLGPAEIQDLLQQYGIGADMLQNVDLSSLSEVLGQGEGVQAVTDVLSRIVQR